ncbi:WD40 repeat-like protein [Dacryopinax primogenitus]|uniref:WD40 repeat-like protein n=1 Tax=Dacryopinax primogenitus (strain DJM 731) TaxID=1858805 RepID=M5FXU1_DACPD|nr:WD40 repeat-like protein [Dacryopinax primogenitus]EJU00600.1 WD40 repeat-like protein [Dacryopinax primogenitus]
MAMDTSDWYASAPGYDVLQPPSLVTTEICPCTSSFPGNFFRSVDWCPDGSSLLTTSEDHVFRIYHFDSSANYVSSHLPLLPPTELPQAGPITAHIWHPHASPTSQTFSILSAVRSQPVQLISASDSQRLASYRIIDHRERFISPLSLAWDPWTLQSDARFWAGTDGALEQFTLSRPGEGSRFPLSGTRKSKEGQRGLISALAFSPSGLLACGSFSRTVGLYDPQDPRSTQGMVDVPGGVTQLSCSPQGTLIAMFRGEEDMWAWDSRMFAEGRHWLLSPRVPAEVSGGAGTQQRLRHSLDPWGRYLFAPSARGTISTYDLLSSPLPLASDPWGGERGVQQPIGSWCAHGDAVGCVALHPSVGCVVTVGGGRHFEDEHEDEAEVVEVVEDGAFGVPVQAAGQKEDRDEHGGDGDASTDSDSDLADDSSDSSSTSSIQILPPRKPHPSSVQYARIIRQSRPRPREATLKIWKFRERVTEEAEA